MTAPDDSRVEERAIINGEFAGAVLRRRQKLMSTCAAKSVNSDRQFILRPFRCLFRIEMKN